MPVYSLSSEEDIDRELTRFATARDEAIREVEKLQAEVERKIGKAFL